MNWEDQAEHWVAWARPPGHDAYWYYRDAKELTRGLGALAIVIPPLVRWLRPRAVAASLPSAIR
jgi:hypothetical protein